MNTESHGETYSHKYTTSTGDIFNKKTNQIHKGTHMLSRTLKIMHLIKKNPQKYVHVKFISMVYTLKVEPSELPANLTNSFSIKKCSHKLTKFNDLHNKSNS